MAVPYLKIETLSKQLEVSKNHFPAYRENVKNSRIIVENALKDGKTYYGINTGFGILANKRIPDNQLLQLQRNLILSHAVGVGDFIPKEISKIMLFLKIHGLGLGFSGVSLTTFNQLLSLFESDLIPAVRKKGSLGASGDLAPLSHMSLPLIGMGLIWDEKGEQRLEAKTVLDNNYLNPIELQAKDGLALINGTQMMSAYGAYVLQRSLRLVKYADLIASMSLEALQGSSKPFDDRIHQIRPHKGQIAVAKNIRLLLQKSEILESHRQCGKVQDPYSLRCIPQVHGATRDAINYAVTALETELNSVTDNPLVLPDGDIISGGNFHGQPLAFAMDFAAIALAELANISERRIYLLLEGHDGLPKLLMKDTGLNSGFMIPQYTAASLVAENKILCHPASVDSIPSSLGQEDHVSMGSISATKLLEVFKNVECVLSIEMLVAAQALDFRLPLKPGAGIDLAFKTVRDQVSHRHVDDLFHRDMEICRDIISTDTLISKLQEQIKGFV